jgi:hypothetical protein
MHTEVQLVVSYRTDGGTSSRFHAISDRTLGLEPVLRC